jgi:hypothetical protein|tara:strand:+ start:5526 stop:7745 length:2220 start_codon:yes stop_codon:yes gene_type:complete
MRPTNTVEAKRLSKSDAVIERIMGKSRSDRVELRFQLLEAAASRVGGFDLAEYHGRFGVRTLKFAARLVDDARAIVQSIDESGIHPALALSALAREALDEADRRSSGAYHTDFRLALHLARSVEDRLMPDMRVVDPACGAGILLAAVSLTACGSDRILANEWLRHCVYAADLSPQALRGTLLSLATLTDDLDALSDMRAKWRVQDSLLAPAKAWETLAPEGFDLVVANPPWEKVKLSRHEYIKASGKSRNYGSSYKKDSLYGYEAAKSEKAEQAVRLVEKFPALAHGEPDLYVAFAELLLQLTRPDGSGALLVPAGLIRSLNTQYLRQELVTSTKELAFTVMENRARHFAIDTRFKFLLVNYVKSSRVGNGSKTIGISHATADDENVNATKQVKLSVGELQKLRPDLTLPEVRTKAEWKLFRKMQANGVSPECDQSPWYPDFCREVDMTRGRPHFRTSPEAKCLPLIEGRMVQPHRLGCKSYVSGEGRSAVWRNLAPAASAISPQFWMPLRALSEEALKRSKMPRAGFCDITGQTNERSMMAVMIPNGLVCGNKVPTVTFPNDTSQERMLLWLSIVNSLPFDWLLRRVVTTTVNYFVLLSVWLPGIEPDSLPGRRLVEISRKLAELDKSGHVSFDKCWQVAELRAEADVLVATAYGCTEADLRLILQDFPLLDRGQPSLPGDDRSTVTADLLLSTWARRKRRQSKIAERVSAAMQLGAIAYLSSEFARTISEAREAAHG